MTGFGSHVCGAQHMGNISHHQINIANSELYLLMAHHKYTVQRGLNMGGGRGGGGVLPNPYSYSVMNNIYV